MRLVADALLSVLIAPVCAACRDPLEWPTRGAVCEGCWARIVPISPPVCDRCGEPLRSWDARRTGAPGRASGLCRRCQDGPGAVSKSRSVGAYDGTLRAVVHALKYDGRRSLAEPLARRMRVAGADVLDGADGVVPVPLHRARRRSRGFNQAEDLSAHLGLPVLGALRRRRATRTQADLTAPERQANVRNAFALRRRVRVRGLCVVLVDDVSTTGATLEACAQALKAAGAREVRALTAARAVSRQP